MCGIAGWIDARRQADGIAATMAAGMSRMVAHRGPDGSGLREISERIALAHRRLAIVDLSAQGSQPMASADGRFTIVFNGEIFNYCELREQLDRQHPGIAWHSTTDTEVLLEAIARWGLERTLEASIGMFAFGLWDGQQQQLSLARDRIGEKPLHYYWDGERFGFASELKGLASLHGGKLNPDSVDLYLALGYVPAPAGIFRNTFKLPAGHWLKFDPTAKTIAVERWWRPEQSLAAADPDPAKRVVSLRNLLRSAVELRLRSDVPVALALSGGLDSSVVAAELAELGAQPEAFTIAFDQDHSDATYAAQVARRFGLRHQVLQAEAMGLEARLAATLDQFDEPFADSSAVASLALAAAVASRYKVILNGDGGDEAFAGYRHYEYIAPKQALKAAAAVVGMRDGCASTVYVESKVLFRASERRQLLGSHAPANGKDPLRGFLASDPYLATQSTRSPDALKRALWSDRHLYLANNLTYKMDMAMSAYGVEGRAPLLDHRVLEWAQNLPASDLVRGREKKILLRRAYRDQLPAEVSARPKHGFGAPVKHWLSGPLASQARGLKTGLLAPQPQQELAAKPGQRQWAVFCFARWAERWNAVW